MVSPLGFKLTLIGTADRARPVIRNVLKRGAWSHTILGVSGLGVINVSANLTDIFFH